MAVEIKRMNFVSTGKRDDTENGMTVFSVYEPDKNLTHGVFDSNDYESVAVAEAAVFECQARFMTVPWKSPFVCHSQILISEYACSAQTGPISLQLAPI